MHTHTYIYIYIYIERDIYMYSPPHYVINPSFWRLYKAYIFWMLIQSEIWKDILLFVFWPVLYAVCKQNVHKYRKWAFMTFRVTLSGDFDLESLKYYFYQIPWLKNNRKSGIIHDSSHFSFHFYVRACTRAHYGSICKWQDIFPNSWWYKHSKNVCVI